VRSKEEKNQANFADFGCYSENAMNKTKLVCVDFDGTCVLHAYPEIGAEAPHAVRVLKKLNGNEVKLILWTIRSGTPLQAAVDWFATRDIRLWAVNKNPQQRFWSNSPKVYAPVYIDDASLGCPLVHPPDGARPYADWVAIERLLQEIGYL
jgi:hypothetical protein